jgi:cytochrome c5
VSARRILAIALLLVACGGLTTAATVGRKPVKTRPLATKPDAARPAAPAPRLHASTAKHLPDGPGRTAVERSCLVCHSAMLITQQHKDAAGWEKTVHLMETWGAPLPAGARDSLLAYLNAHFSPTR